MLELLSYVALFTQPAFASLLVSSISVEPEFNCSKTFAFVCNDNRCIPLLKRCDGFNDCSDLSDETDCEIYLCQEPSWFTCKNKKCISKSFVCDAENDCGDFSDEQQCSSLQGSTLKTSHNCSANEWQCSDRLCIPTEWVCNGELDCLDGSDENVGCEKHSACDGFKCKNSQCIPKQWRCDKTNDCKDGSDEEGCAFTPEDCSLDKGLFQCLTDKSCIKSSELCDGIVHCHDKSDESTLCINASCSLFNCSHNCMATPLGVQCLCPHGYHATNSVNCTDINECEIYGTCDQKCRNVQGSYECYCDEKYSLQDDKKTCAVKNGEAFMIFSTKNEIRGYFLQAQLYFPIAKQLKQAIGVAFDGQHVYWTEIFSGNESIVRSLEDGTRREVLVTSGLGTPEDLSVDWITGNIYFTDSEMQHIGVCTNDGIYCTVLVNQALHKPRSIVLNPLDGQMYWSDWGKRPEIARAKMDGTEDISFVVNEIYWPNGLALDMPNERLYWTDAKSLTIESIKLDGSGRRVILQGIVKHPYGLAVFENRIYWSDWSTHSIESCDKFTGRDHHVLIKQGHEYIYDIDIYHSALHSRRNNPCTLAFCSDICLISGRSYTCACPQNKVLDADKHTCKVVVKNQQLIIGTRSALLPMQYQQLGKHNITEIPAAFRNISALAYNSINHSLFISDYSTQTLIMMDIQNGHTQNLLRESDSDDIVAMDFDPLGNNLYWCESKKGVVEVLNLNTMSRKVLLSDMAGETPMAIALVVNEGIMFVAFQTSKHSAHIDRLRMDGSDRTHVAEQGLLGPLHLLYDSELHRVFWADSGSGLIASTSTDGDDRHTFRTLDSSPVGIASMGNNIFWINRKSNKLYWAAKTNSDNNNKMIDVETPGNTEIVYLISITPPKISTHPCHQNNGNCSHLCLVAVGSATCACPLGMKLGNDNKTCTKPKFCELNEFLCQQSDVCIANDMRCDERRDCFFGEDEENCDPPKQCPSNYFQCKNNDCVKKNLICDKHFDCKDNSDEADCGIVNEDTSCLRSDPNCITDECLRRRLLCDGQNVTCNSKQFRCNSGLCIPKNWECDQEFDCHDMSDEHKDCGYAVCKSPKFPCNNGLCIDALLKCNKVDDCGDFSDEISCPVSSYETNCGRNEFRCYRNESLCLPMTSRCNGSSECPHHEDEQGCSNCHMDEFECSNKKCIARQWLCDHVDDCGDDSDENLYMCAHDQEFPVQSSSCDKRFRCKNGNCVDMSEVCNAKDDCGDGSDEDGACSLSCIKDNNPCSHICMRTPIGPQCYCNSGYKLRGDGRTCTDIKECSFEPPVCSQICNEISGSFLCSCYDGYILRSDESSCKSVGEGMSLIFAASNELYRLFYANNTLNILYSENIPKITGIDVSVKKNLVYFSTESGNLHRLHLLHGTHEYIRDVGRPKNLVVEWISENIYFVNDDADASKSIRVCNFETQHCTDVLNINRNSKISALAIDAVNEYMFYAQSSWKMFSSSTSTIYRCNLDGSNLQQISNSNSDYITGLTYNFYRKVLYYGDYHSGKIYKINYDGTNQAEIIVNLSRPTSLSVFDNHLYFYTADGRMTICPLFKDYQACKSYRVYGQFSELFVIFHSSRQPDKPRNPCENHNCTYLCIPANNASRCLCDSEAVNSDLQRCHNTQVTRVSYQQMKYEGEEKNQSSFSTTGAISLMLGISITVTCMAVYYYFQKRRSGNFTISMRFQNPIYGNLQESSQETVIHPGQHEYYNPINAVAAVEMEKVAL